MNKSLEKKQLFDEDSDVEEESLNLKTNKDYANKFNNLREKELYKKCKYIHCCSLLALMMVVSPT